MGVGLYHRSMLRHFLRNVFLMGAMLFLGSASLPIDDLSNNVRAYTRSLEFDYLTWTLDAIDVKLKQALIGQNAYVSEEESSHFVRNYLGLVSRIHESERDLIHLIADPERDSLTSQIAAEQAELELLIEERDQVSPLAEAILQDQLAEIIKSMDLDVLGAVFPPVLFHSTPLPWALIVSPREGIWQEANISLQTNLNVLEHIALENAVGHSLDVSTLVVPVGGIGSYPTMIAQSSNLNWLVEVIAHEWIHNFLTLRPLGLLYERNQGLRTINESVANIAGKELGAEIIKRYYPELVPLPTPAPNEVFPENTIFEEGFDAPFDFRAEMYETRIKVDALLVNGAIDEAEAYMEARRLIFWDAGYAIRKLNQAYFAFHGSYADQAAGPAGEDPVGNAVRALRAQSNSLEAFVRQLAYVTSVEELMKISQNVD